MASDDNAPATKVDLKTLENRLSQKIGDVENKFSQKIGDVENKLSQKIGDVKNTLNKKIDSVAVELVKTQADIRRIKETMSTKDDVSRIMNAIDAFARKAETYGRKALSHSVESKS